MPIFSKNIGIWFWISGPKNTDINAENTDMQMLPMSYRFSDQIDPADFESELIFKFLITKTISFWELHV